MATILATTSISTSTSPSISTPLSSSTYTSVPRWNCYLTGTAPTTVFSTTTYTPVTRTYGATTTTYGSAYEYVAVAISFPLQNGTCERGYMCDEVKIRDDIIGIGVIVAFFITAWAAFIFLIVAYWTGLLPQHLLRPIDSKIFKANSRRCHSEWKETLDHVTLLFSDQQLLTGIGILLAAYYEVFARDLDALHWHTVTYLAWMSSTVHLITLSLLKERLHENKTLRNLRLTGMLVLLALLIAALAPGVSIFFVSTPDLLPGFYSQGHGTAVPTKCFYGFGYGDNWHPYENFQFRARYSAYLSDSVYDFDSYVAFPAVLSYVTLIGSYIWKLTQLFDESLSLVRRTLRYMPEARLELAARRILTRHHRSTWYELCLYFAIKVIYLTFCVFADLLDSFAATNLVLFFTLMWGTLQVVLPRIWLVQETEITETLSFGQILPLLLLLQPVVAVIGHYAVKEPSQRMRVTSSTYETLLPYRISAYETLANALRHNKLLTATEKANGHHDPMKEHLLSSRAYNGLLWTQIMGFFGLGVVFCVLGIIQGLRDTNSYMVYIVGYTIAGWVCWFILWMLIFLPFSTKLR